MFKWRIKKYVLPCRDVFGSTMVQMLYVRFHRALRIQNIYDLEWTFSFDLRFHLIAVKLNGISIELKLLHDAGYSKFYLPSQPFWARREKIHHVQIRTMFVDT